MRTLLTLALALIISFAAPAMAGNPLDTLKKFSSEITFEKDVITIATHNDNRYQFDVEIAASQRQQAKGLMNRKSMAPNEGMLFIFGHSRKTAFWMKNTLIPLDMIFIDKNGRIDHIHHNAKPLDEAQITSPRPVAAVLEINGGQAGSWGIEVGDTVYHDYFKNILP